CQQHVVSMSAPAPRTPARSKGASPRIRGAFFFASVAGHLGLSSTTFPLLCIPPAAGPDPHVGRIFGVPARAVPVAVVTANPASAATMEMSAVAIASSSDLFGD